MEHTSWPVDFRLIYPEGCTPKEARELLAGWSRHWRGWGAFPWRCTRNIHRYVNDLPVRFQSVMVHQWVCGQSSWLVLNALDEWMLGRRLRSWARGGDMPDPIAVPVRQERRNGKTVILPVEEDAKAMVRAGKKTGEKC